MKWTDLLAAEVEYTYGCTQKLIDLVDEDSFGWKPDTGDNWMTTGQLLMHITDACGSTFKAFVTGDWGVPEGVDTSDVPMEELLLSAERMPTIGSIDEAKKLLAEDKALALKMIEEVGEDRLENDPAPAPWDPIEVRLGHRLLGMIGHLTQHKAQLFYYLKLQGKPVNTMHLWGM